MGLENQRKADKTIKKQAGVDKAPGGGRADGGSGKGFVQQVWERIRKAQETSESE